MNVAFVCCTPYQLFNAINYIIGNPADSFDIFICDHFNCSLDIYKNLTQCSLLNQCYYLTTNVRQNIFRRIFYALKPDIKKISNYNKTLDYDEVVIGSFNNITTALFYKYCKKHKKKLSIIDEGVGSYYFKNIRNDWKHKYLRILLGHVVSKKHLNQILLYNPKLFIGEKDIAVSPLPKLSRNNIKVKNILNRIFLYSGGEKLSGKVVYFDQPLKQYIYKGNEVTQTEYSQFVIKEIQAVVGPDGLIVKWQPRTPETIQKNFIRGDKQNTSLGGWEMELLNGANRNVYVSVCSTAALLGNMLFNDGDTIILLYKTEKYNPKEYEAIDLFIKRMRQTNVNILLPTSWSEFSVLLKKSYSSINSISF